MSGGLFQTARRAIEVNRADLQRLARIRLRDANKKREVLSWIKAHW